MCEKFARVDASYGQLVLVKRKYVANKPRIVVDEAMLQASPDGVEIGNCAPVFCSPEQRSAIQLVCQNVARINGGEGQNGEEGDDEVGDGFLGLLKKAVNSKVVNADTYIL